MEAINIATALPELHSLRGKKIGVSDWKRIDQSDIDQFSELTGDAGPIHNDPETAAKIAPFGGTIVQGFLMLSCLTGFAKNLRIPQADVAFRLNYGFDRVRIITPVPVGSRIRGCFEMTELSARGENAVLMTLGVVVEVEGQTKPAIAADWLTYFQFTPKGPK